MHIYITDFFSDLRTSNYTRTQNTQAHKCVQRHPQFAHIYIQKHKRAQMHTQTYTHTYTHIRIYIHTRKRTNYIPELVSDENKINTKAHSCTRNTNPQAFTDARTHSHANTQKHIQDWTNHRSMHQNMHTYIHAQRYETLILFMYTYIPSDFFLVCLVWYKYTYIHTHIDTRNRIMHTKYTYLHRYMHRYMYMLCMCVSVSIMVHMQLYMMMFLYMYSKWLDACVCVHVYT